MDRTDDRRRVILICTLLSVATLAAYWPVLHHEFVNIDDLPYLVQNPHVHSGLSWENIGWAFTTGYAANWHPLTWMSHMLDCQIFGLDPRGHHLTSLLFHTANTVLLFLLLRRLTGALWRSVFVAALFALHPLHVESVAWVAERKDVLSGFFFMLTLLAYAGYVSRIDPPPSDFSAARRRGSGGPGSGDRQTSSPPRLVADRQVGEGRGEGKGEGNPANRGQTRKATLLYALTLALFAMGLMSKPMLVTLPFVLLLLDYWPFERFNAPAFPRFNVLTFQRSNDPKEQRFNGSANASALRLFREKLPFFALSILSCIVTVLVQRHGGAVATMAHVPLDHRIANALVSCVAYILKMAWPADLAMYYPPREVIPIWMSGGAFAVLAVVSAAAFALRRRFPWLAVGWLWYLVMLLPVIGLVQVGLQSMADRYTYLPMIGLFLAITWTAANVPPVNRRPSIVIPRAVLALAILALCAVLTSAQARLWKDSETLYRHTLAVAPRNPVIHLNLGSALLQQGRAPEAADQFAAALSLEPRYADALSDWGFALVLQGKVDQGIAKYRQALALNPRLAQTHYDLGQALLAQRKRLEAIEEFQTALQINPDWPPALNDLAWLKATDADPQARDGTLAVQLAERACRVTAFEYPMFIGTLAAAYAETGRFADAVAAAEKASALATRLGNAALATRNQQLLELYRNHHPYHEPP
jgi:Flp pilus assembly protein TadD